MTIAWVLIRQQVKSYWRTPFRGHRAASFALGLLGAAYISAMLVLIGLLFDDVTRNLAGHAPPLTTLANGLLPFGLIYVFVRAVFEHAAAVRLKPYYYLPISSGTMAAFASVLALLSAWNAVPIAFFATVCIEAFLDGAGLEAAGLGLCALGVLCATSYVAPMLRSTVADYPLAATGVVAILLAATGLDAFSPEETTGVLRGLSDWLFGGAMHGQLLPTGAVALTIFGTAGGYIQWFQRTRTVDQETQSVSITSSSTILTRLQRWGPAWREAVMELRLLLRNAQPRPTFFIGLLLVIAVAYFLSSSFTTTDLEGLPASTVLMLGMASTSWITIQHGQNIFSWEGSFFDATVSRPVSPAARVNGKWIFLGVSGFLLFLAPLPSLIMGASAYVLPHTSFFLYNVGVLSPAVIGAATLNRKALNINERTLSESNVSIERMAVLLPLVGLPLLPLIFIDGPFLQYGVIGGTGIISLVLIPAWRRGLAALYRHRRYTMARGFQELQT